MGGYGSGRTKRHLTTSECIQIDTTKLKRYLSEPGSHAGSITYKGLPERYYTDGQASIGMLVECFAAPQEESRAARYPVCGNLSLFYGVRRAGKEPVPPRQITLPLVTTPCNYGGRRWWLIAPCCGRRVRVVYLSYQAMLPYCRVCLDLHYQSQQQSFIEKHKTYERYLLSNYGWAWAEIEYQRLGKHYQEITPELAEKKARSQFHAQLRMIRHLIAFNRLMLADHIRTFCSLRSLKDRCMYIEGLLHEWGSSHILLILEQSSKRYSYATDEEIEALRAIIAGKALPARDYTYDTPRLVAMEEEIEEELEKLAA